MLRRIRSAVFSAAAASSSTATALSPALLRCQSVCATTTAPPIQPEVVLRRREAPASSSNNDEDQEQQQQKQYEEAALRRRRHPIISVTRLRDIRHMLEGRDPAGVPPTKFGGFFDEPDDAPGSYTVSLRELEELITELGTHRTPDELEIEYVDAEQQQQQQQQQQQTSTAKASSSSASSSRDVVIGGSGSAIQPQPTTAAAGDLQPQREPSVAKLFPAVSNARWEELERSVTTTNLDAVEDTALIPHPETRSPHVTDSIERRLLLAYAIFSLNHMVEPPGSNGEPTTRAVNPRMYMRFVAGGIGYAIARDIVQQILAEEMPLNPEVIRYHTELALVLESKSLMRDAILFARGDSLTDEDAAHFFGAPAKQTRAYFDLREMSCAALLTAIGDYVFKKCVIALLEGEGEGDASRNTLLVLKWVLPMLPGDMQGPLVKHLVDESHLMLREANERRAKLQRWTEERVMHFDTSLRNDQLETSAEVMCETAAAVLKAISGSEVAHVIDKSGAMHFEIACSLFTALRSMNRMSESCGVAEETMRFYEANKETLRLEHLERKKIEAQYDADEKEDQAAAAVAAAAAAQAKSDDTDAGTHAPEGKSGRAAGAAAASAPPQQEEAPPTAVAPRPQVESDDPTNEGSDNEFELLYRRVYFQYLTDRARTDPASGIHNILAACEKHPKSAEAFRLLGLCLFRLERYGEALNAIDRSCVLNPINPHFHRLRAHILYRLKEYLTAERENFLADALHECEEGLRPQLLPEDVMAATGPLLVEADRRREELKRDLLRDHNGDPKSRPQLPLDMETALAIREQRDPATGALITRAASQLLAELVMVQLPDTESEMRHYLHEMRRYHIYSRQGGSAPLRPRNLLIPALWDLQVETYGQETQLGPALKSVTVSQELLEDTKAFIEGEMRKDVVVKK